MRDRAAQLFAELQGAITAGIEKADGRSKFQVDLWDRKDLSGKEGGGGDTRILQNGAVFEQAGVNYSRVAGLLPAEMTQNLLGQRKEAEFFASGVSLVIHPYSPMVPTVHANFRYLEVDDKAWFGGGADLTPSYLFDEDVVHFHSVLKGACDRHDPQYFRKFKKWCDEYFYLPHRGETRGVGGIFFDYLGKDSDKTDRENFEKLFLFVKDAGESFLPAYLPIVERTKALPFGEAEKSFQLLRRGRYVEFNLLYDRGTLFGLKTGGRTESILMSLPCQARWEYSPVFAADSREARLLSTLRTTRNWVPE